MRMSNYTLKHAQQMLPARKKSDNKASAGRTLIIAGSEGMFGAAVLCAEAAARVGSGYVSLFTKKNAFLTVKHPSFLLVDSDKNRIPFERASAVAIGPGLGKSAQSAKWLKEVIKERPERVVIDADALTIASDKNLWPLPPSWIATPHEGELSRILKTTSENVRKDREKAVQKARDLMGCVVVLKGHETLIAGEKNFRVRSGNAALAKAGTGDVLTGLITGLLAQGMVEEEAACLGVFVHGWLADEWVKEGNDPLSLMPEDLLERMPKALARLRKAT